jgi:hypothetical protein
MEQVTSMTDDVVPFTYGSFYRCTRARIGGIIQQDAFALAGLSSTGFHIFDLPFCGLISLQI